MTAGLFTIGHSTLSRREFLILLAGAPADLVLDIRSYPTSRWEWFRRSELERWLPEAGVEYRWLPALGGRRGPPSPELVTAYGGEPPECGGWTAEGFANYEWHTLSREFAAAAREVRAAGAVRGVALMCAEGVWWRCHRSMVADYLVVCGAEVIHLQPRRTPHSQVVGERLCRYHPLVLAEWRRRAQEAPAHAAS